MYRYLGLCAFDKYIKSTVFTNDIYVPVLKRTVIYGSEYIQIGACTSIVRGELYRC